MRTMWNRAERFPAVTVLTLQRGDRDWTGTSTHKVMSGCKYFSGDSEMRPWERRHADRVGWPRADDRGAGTQWIYSFVQPVHGAPPRRQAPGISVNEIDKDLCVMRPIS